MKLEEVTRRFWKLYAELQDSKEELKKSVSKIRYLENERDVYQGMYDTLNIKQKRKFSHTLNWIYKREMLGWCIAAALSLVWIINYIIT